jgi:Rps23 Pro-64 3,4-dihydroxylase Tpa1-like proline 4-hydroxylase
VAKEKRQNVSGSKNETPTVECSGDDRLQQCAQEATDSGSINKIRDIIFGNQMRDYDTRFEDLENYLKNEIKRLNDEAVQRHESLERFVATEVKALGERLLQEQQTRATDVETLSKNSEESTKKISLQIEKLEHIQNKETAELRQLLKAEVDSLSIEMQKKYAAQTENLAREADTLRSDKIERIAFAELLVDMARRLSDEIAVKYNIHADASKE